MILRAINSRNYSMRRVKNMIDKIKTSIEKRLSIDKINTMLENITIPVMVAMVVSLATITIVAFLVRNNNYDKILGYVGIGIEVIGGIFLIWMCIVYAIILYLENKDDRKEN